MSSHPTDAGPPPGGLAATSDLPGLAYSPGQLQEPSESGSTLVTYDPCYFTPVPSPDLVLPAPSESARNLHDRLHPGAVVDDALVTSQEARDFFNMTPFAPSLPHDTPGAQAVLAASLYVPTPLSVVVPTTLGEEGPLSAPASDPFILPQVPPRHASAHPASAASMHDSQLPLPSLTPSPVGQVAALVDRLQHELLFDDYTRDAAVRELVSWVAHTYAVPDASGILWDAHWAPAIHEAVDRERRNVDKLRAAAAAVGFDLVPKETDEPTPKRTCPNVAASTGRKRTRLGSLPPSRTRTPDHFQADIPIVTYEPQNLVEADPSSGPLGGPTCEISLSVAATTAGNRGARLPMTINIERPDAEMKNGDASSMETRLPRLEASIHTPTTPDSLVAPIDPVQKAILEQLGNIGQTLASFNVKFTNIEARLAAETGNLPAPPALPRASPLPSTMRLRASPAHHAFLLRRRGKVGQNLPSPSPSLRPLPLTQASTISPRSPNGPPLLQWSLGDRTRGSLSPLVGGPKWVRTANPPNTRPLRSQSNRPSSLPPRSPPCVPSSVTPFNSLTRRKRPFITSLLMPPLWKRARPWNASQSDLSPS